VSALGCTTVIVPARDEAAAVGNVVAGLFRSGAARVVVVDNASRDATRAVARAAGAEVVDASRRGYGWACLAGTRAAHGSELVGYIDGDGSFRARDLARLAELVSGGQADLAIGVRGRTAIMPAHQRVGNAATCAALRALYGVTISDVAPLRVIRADLLRELDMQGTRYAWLIEMLAKAARRGARIAACEVDYGPRQGGTSKVSGSARGSLLAGLDFFRALATYRTW